MAIGYFGVKLSGNVIETPEGYIDFILTKVSSYLTMK